MKSIIFFILPFLKNYRNNNDYYRKHNDSMLYQNACIEDEEMCIVQVVNGYNAVKPNIENLKKYLTDDVIEDYEECILSGNDGCDTYWYIDKNYTQRKIENGIISYLDKKPLKWVNIKNKDSEN